MLRRLAGEHATQGTKGSLLSMLHAHAPGRHCAYLCPRRDRLNARGRHPSLGHAQVPAPFRDVPPTASCLQRNQKVPQKLSCTAFAGISAQKKQKSSFWMSQAALPVGLFTCFGC